MRARRAAPAGSRLRWPLWVPDWVSFLGVAVLLAATWTVVYVTGGTRTALPHLFYLPIVLAVLPFGLWGGVLAGVVAALLCGPLMPLDTQSGEPQQAMNWLVRGAFFAAVGAFTGAIVRSAQEAYASSVRERIDHDLRLSDDAAELPDPARVERIRSVLGTRAFHVVFQPIYALDDGRLFAVEALTRFEDEPYQPPDVWFGAAAKTGLGVELELAAFAEALEASATGLPADVEVAVNCSPSALTDVRLLELLDRHPDRRVIVEVTEHAVIDDYGLLESVRGQLRQRGVRLAIDDAGAGFASLRHIVRLGPEIIKLDRTLVQDLRLDPVRQALASSLIHFATQTRSELVAEGIEHTADLYACRGLGVHAAQGYLLARPGPLPVPARLDLVYPRTRSRDAVAPHR